MELDDQNSTEQVLVEPSMIDQISTDKTIIHEGLDYNAHSLLDLAIMVESEITGQSIVEFKNSFRLQMIVLKSQFKDTLGINLETLNRLLHHVYGKQGFSVDWKAFFKVKNVLLSKVLARRKGVPISLGILLIEMLTEIGFDAQGICFPSGFIVVVNLEGKAVYLDPFNGELVDKQQLELKVRGQLGNHMRLTPDMLKIDSKETVIKRYINVIKASYIQDEKVELALLCSDILLRLDPDDAYEVRDRGFLFQQLDCFKLACNDFTYFIEQCPKDPIVSLLQQQIKYMDEESSTQTIH